MDCWKKQKEEEERGGGGGGGGKKVKIRTDGKKVRNVTKIPFF
jgi:hypothetical protein